MEALTQPRIQWIDTAKLLGIYFVILGHISLTNHNITNVIYSFHMPLFFFLSGLTQKNEKITDTFRKGVRALLIPYLFFYLINLVKAYFWRPEYFADGFIKPILGLFVGVGFDTPFSIMAMVPLWFLVGLFCCKMLYSVILNVSGHNGYRIQFGCCILFVTTAYLLNTHKLFLPFSLGSAFLAYPFFIIGKACSSNIIRVLSQKHNNKQIIALIFIMTIAIAINVLLTIINKSVSVATISFGNNILLFYVTAFFGIVFITIISSFINKLPNFLNVLAKNTIIILALHGITTKILIIPLTKLGLAEICANKAALIPSVPLAIAVAIVSLLLNLIPIYIINKYFPWMIGTKKNYSLPLNKLPRDNGEA